jgi:hypothetical protein
MLIDVIHVHQRFIFRDVTGGLFRLDFGGGFGLSQSLLRTVRAKPTRSCCARLQNKPLPKLPHTMPTRYAPVFTI